MLKPGTRDLLRTAKRNKSLIPKARMSVSSLAKRNRKYLGKKIASKYHTFYEKNKT